MKTILITGNNGFIGKELTELFLDQKDIKMLFANRQKLNLTDSNKVDSFFNNNNIDIVIHAAVTGIDYQLQQSINDFFDNIVMFNNLIKYKDKFKLMINFGSGAEFNLQKDIVLAKEEDIFKNNPSDYYGLSKNLIARKIYDMNSNIVNMRLFGCFGKHELNTRFIKNSINRVACGKSIIINKNKKMDFIFVEDVYNIINYYINNFDYIKLPKDINLCYNEKNTLETIANKILYFTNSDSNIIINNEFGNEYTGSADKLEKLQINLNGLDAGIKKMVSSYE